MEKRKTWGKGEEPDGGGRGTQWHDLGERGSRAFGNLDISCK